MNLFRRVFPRPWVGYLIVSAKANFEVVSKDDTFDFPYYALSKQC